MDQEMPVWPKGGPAPLGGPDDDPVEEHPDDELVVAGSRRKAGTVRARASSWTWLRTAVVTES